MNRRQLSPPRLRPKNVDTDIHRIINHAARLVMEYNHMKVENIMQSDIDNQEKVNKLLRLSSTQLPRLMNRFKNKRKHKESDRKKSIRKAHVSKSDDNAEGSQNKKNNSIKSAYSSTFCETQEVNALRQSKCDASYASMDNQTENVLEQTSENKNVLRNDATFRYEIEIKTGNEKKSQMNGDVSIILNGDDSKTSTKYFLREFLKLSPEVVEPFQPDSINTFEIYLTDYLGTIEGVVVGLDSKEPNDSSWFLEYISIRDCTSAKEFRFSCLKWFGESDLDHYTEYEFRNDQINEAALALTDIQGDNDSNISLECIFAMEANIQKSQLEENRSQSSKDPLKPNILNISVDVQSEAKSSSPSLKQHDMERISSSEVSENGTEGINCEKREEQKNNSEIMLVKINDNQLTTVQSNQPNDDVKITESAIQVPLARTIHSAIKDQDVEAVKNLCNSDETVKFSEDEEGLTPLHVAAIYYEDSDVCKEIIQYLLSMNVDPNAKSTKGYSPLHLAIINGNIESVKYFYKVVNADFNVRDDRDNTNVELAIWNDCDEIAEYLEAIKEEVISKERIKVSHVDHLEQKNHGENVDVCDVIAEDDASYTKESEGEECLEKIIEDQTNEDGNMGGGDVMAEAVNEEVISKEEIKVSHVDHLEQNNYDKNVDVCDVMAGDEPSNTKEAEGEECLETIIEDQTNEDRNIGGADFLTEVGNDQVENIIHEDNDKQDDIIDGTTEDLINTTLPYNGLKKEKIENTDKKDGKTEYHSSDNSSNEEEEDEEDDNRGISFKKKIFFKNGKQKTSNIKKKLRFSDESSISSKASDSDTSPASSRSSSPLTPSVVSSCLEFNKTMNEPDKDVDVTGNINVETTSSNLKDDRNDELKVDIPVDENHIKSSTLPVTEEQEVPGFGPASTENNKTASNETFTEGVRTIDESPLDEHNL